MLTSLGGAAVAWAIVATMSPDARLAAEVAARVGPRVERGELVGVVVGVVRGDGSTKVFGFGRTAIDGGARPDGRTLFEIGSITKLFTAIALADMAREGLVGLDDPVARLLPEGTRVPDFAGRAITLRTLADQTSGLPRVIPKVFILMLAGKDPYAEVTTGDVLDFLRGYELRVAPGSTYSYSNLGPGLLGLALARRAGTSYERLIVDRVARPLGMRDTVLTVDESRRPRLAIGHTEERKPAVAWAPDAFAGAGALRSTADDMIIFLRANLGRGDGPPRLLAAMDEARVGRAETGYPGLQVGVGCHLSAAGAGPARPEVAWHNGETSGFGGFVGLSRARGVGVVVLANSAAVVDPIGVAILDRLVREPR